jgi:peptide/nickel transport system substrate-binding protein
VLEPILTVNWYPKVARKDYGVGLSISENSLDERDQSF